MKDKMADNIAEASGLLDSESEAFMKRVYAGGIGRYEKRLEALGFIGMDSVMDAGCGFGQWSLALARHNGNVWGVDISPGRIKCAESMARQNGFFNIHFRCSSLEDLEFSDKYFDGIFCYSTIHHADESRTLDELWRLIKPGGLLYLNFNSLGWFLYLFLIRGILGRDRYSLTQSVRAMSNFIRGKNSGYHVVTVKRLSKELSERGFKILAMDGDGSIKLADEPMEVYSFYEKYYFGLPGVWEVLAVKQC